MAYVFVIGFVLYMTLGFGDERTFYLGRKIPSLNN